MKPRIERWGPVTCGCRVYQYYDENGVMTFVNQAEAEVKIAEIYAQYPENTVHPSEWIAKNRVRKCTYHADLEQGPELGAVIKKEGRQLVGVLRTLEGHEGIDLGLHEDKFNEKNEYVGQGLKEGIECIWYFDGEGADRKLVYEIQGATLTKAQQDLLDATVEEKFGVIKEVK